MILSIDIGNSDVVFGLFKDPETHVANYRTTTSEQKNEESYALEFSTFLMEKSISVKEIEGACISSVVPVLTAEVHELCRSLGLSDIVVITADLFDSLPVKVANRHEIGSDLVANATRAFLKYGGPCIIVDFGTALTFTTLDREGVMSGVAIAPGIKTAFESLFSKTAKLPEVAFDVPDSVFGRDTSTAIQAGIFFGYEGMVKEIVQRIKEETGLDYTIIGTGGLVNKMKDLAGLFTEVDQLLTLRGITEIYRLVK